MNDTFVADYLNSLKEGFSLPYDTVQTDQRMRNIFRDDLKCIGEGGGGGAGNWGGRMLWVWNKKLF